MCETGLMLVPMTIRHLLVMLAIATLCPGSSGGQVLPTLAGRWQYLQPPDTEGEVLDFACLSGRWRGIMNGLERAGDHGLYYYVVEVEQLDVSADGRLRFEIGTRSFFSRRPALSNLSGKGEAGIARSRMRFSGRIEGGDLVLRCSGDGSCPDSVLRFKRLSAPR
jgi:hypothetical protein